MYSGFLKFTRKRLLATWRDRNGPVGAALELPLASGWPQGSPGCLGLAGPAMTVYNSIFSALWFPPLSGLKAEKLSPLKYSFNISLLEACPAAGCPLPPREREGRTSRKVEAAWATCWPMSLVTLGLWAVPRDLGL